MIFTDFDKFATDMYSFSVQMNAGFNGKFGVQLFGRSRSYVARRVLGEDVDVGAATERGRGQVRKLESNPTLSW